MTQYLLSVWGVEGDPQPSEAEIQQMFARVDTFNEKLKANGQWVFAGGLHPVSTATTIRLKDGQPTTTDGPFAETKEHLGGFWVIEANDLDVALALAAEGAVACGGPVEVRPFDNAV